jgi:inorganic pyrophosphatase
MNILHDIDPKRITKEEFIVVIEIAKGSKKKYEMDKETGLLLLDRFLTTAFRYPINYGFVPLTHCEDNDPLDVLVLSQEILDPMTLVKCRPLGVIKMIDNYELDKKIIAVPVFDNYFSHLQDLKDIPLSIISEIQHFLENYKALEKTKVVIEAIQDKQAAFRDIETSLLAYQKVIQLSLNKEKKQ